MGDCVGDSGCGFVELSRLVCPQESMTKSKNVHKVATLFLSIYPVTLFLSSLSFLAHDRGRLSKECSLVFPGNRIHLPWWVSNATINWKFIDHEINPPLYFHCTKGFFWNMFVVNNRPLVVLLIIHFNRCKFSIQWTVGISINFIPCHIKCTVHYKMRVAG